MATDSHKAFTLPALVRHNQLLLSLTVITTKAQVCHHNLLFIENSLLQCPRMVFRKAAGYLKFPILTETHLRPFQRKTTYDTGWS